MNAVVARVLAALTLVAGAAVLFGPPPAAIAGGLLLALVLPGLAVSATLFRGRLLSAVERTVLAPALSLAVLVIAGLVIYVSGFALNRPAWTAATVGVTLLALIVPGVPLPRRSAEQVAAAEGREAEITDLAAAAKLAVQSASGTDEAKAEADRAGPGMRGGSETARSETARSETARSETARSETARSETARSETAGAEAVPSPVVGSGAPASVVLAVRGEKAPLKRIGRQLIPMVLVLAVLGGAGWLSFTSSRNRFDTTVTALSAAPPAAPDATGARTLTVTASGLIVADGPYRVVVAADGGSTSTRTVTVSSDGTWSGKVSMGRTRTTIKLYRASDVTAYRTLHVAAAQ